MWIAGKHQKIKRNGEYINIVPGDPVPEAAEWAKCWEQQGYVFWEPEEVRVTIEDDSQIPEPKTETKRKRGRPKKR